jgi:pyridoxamine 5'-phosphate oxidase-like protein
LNLILADRYAKPLSKREVIRMLSRPNILRLAYLDEGGDPIVHPVWYYYSRGKFLVATDRESRKARALNKNSSVYFLVDESPKGGTTRGVRGKAIAKVVDSPLYGAEVTKRNVKKYLGTLRSKAARMVLEMGSGSCVLEITPSYMAAWKF